MRLLRKKSVNTKTSTAAQNPKTGNTSNLTKSPKTDDAGNFTLWIALLFAGGGAAIGTSVVRRNKKYNR